MKHKPGLFESLLLKLGVSRFDIFKEEDGEEELYLRRFHLLKHNKWLSKLTGGKYEGIYLHHILRPDDDRHLHDHPWAFGALILAGGYDEDIPHPKYLKWRHGNGLLTRTWRPLSFRTSEATQLHRISKENFKKTWTLFFAGPKFRKWGFYTESGWEPYDVYLAKYCPNQLTKAKNVQWPDDKSRIDPDSD